MNHYQLIPRSDRASLKHIPWEYGRSVNGVPLLCYGPKIGEEALSMVVTGGIHGNEPDTTVALSSALRCIHPQDLKARVILALNPDGLLMGTRGNANGVDLNRNFPDNDYSTQPSLIRWAEGLPYDMPMSTGIGPGSEPEVQAFIKLLQTVEPQVLVDFHSPLAWIDQPVAGVTAQWLSEQTGLSVVDNAGYPTPGSTGTWCDEHNIGGITFEFEGASNSALRLKYTQVLADLLTGYAPVG